MAEKVEPPTMAEVIQEAIRAALLDLHVALPARVDKYDKDKQKANIQPLLYKKYKSDGLKIKMPIIPGVPVQHPSANGGKAFIHLPIKKGDLGTAIFCDRSIDKYLAGDGGIVDPDDPRHHDLSDAIFIPGVLPFSEALQGILADDLMVVNDNMKLTLYPDGKVSIEGASEEMVAVISDFFQHVHDSTMVTTCPAGAGTGEMDTATKTILAADKVKIDTLKK